MSAGLRVQAPAKINLWLRVFGRDAKGYHAIETLYQLVSITDELILERTDSGVSLAGAPPALGAVGDNLIVRAAQAFFRAAGVKGGTAVTLSKRIPWNAGLGGASSDAAAVLLGLNRLYGNRLPYGELMEIGAALGSDVPFFLTLAPLALAWGRGERLLSLPPLPSRPLLVVPPPAPVKTAEAYGWIDRDRGSEDTGEFAAVFPQAALTSWAEVRKRSHNDFEPVVAGRVPAIGHWLDRVRSTQALLVRLAGSGGAIVAIYETAEARDAAWRRLGAEPSMLRGETLTAPLPMEDA